MNTSEFYDVILMDPRCREAVSYEIERETMRSLARASSSPGEVLYANSGLLLGKPFTFVDDVPPDRIRVIYSDGSSAIRGEPAPEPWMWWVHETAAS